MTEYAKVTRQEAIAVITLDDQARRNALSEGMVGGLVEALRVVSGDREVRAAVLTGSGGTFCSGGALDEMVAHREDGPWETQRRIRSSLHRLMLEVWNLDIPVIAAIDGAAVGAGMDLALACDMRLATEKAVLCVGFARVGLVPGEGGAWLLPRLVGPDRALELMCSARQVPATEARDLGLVTELVGSDQELLARAIALAESVSRWAPDVVAATKRLVRAGESSTFEQSLELSSAHLGMASVADHHQQILAERAAR